MKWEVRIPRNNGQDSTESMDIEAPNWLSALQEALSKMGEQGIAVRNLSCDIKPDHTVHVIDFVSRRSFVLRPHEIPTPSIPPGPPPEPEFVQKTGPRIPEYEVFFSRNESPNEQLNISYRERIVAVSPSVTEENALALVRHLFEELKKEAYDPAKKRYINIAVFDHKFTMRSQKPAIVSLVWKEWTKLDPDLFFPMKVPNQAEASAAIPLLQRSRRSTVPPPAGAKIQEHLPLIQIQPAAAQAPAAVSTKASEPSFKPAMQPIYLQEKAKPAAESKRGSVPPVEKAKPAADSRRGSAPPAEKARPVAESKRGSAPPAEKAKPVAESRRASVPPQRPSLTGTEDEHHALVEVFELLQDLYNLRDRVEATRFAFELAKRHIPCDYGRCLVTSANHVNLEVTGAFGPDAKAHIGMKYPVQKGLYGLCIREGMAICISDTHNDKRFAQDLALRSDVMMKSLLCAPVQYEGRTFGILELVNPKGGKGFSSVDVNILSYIAGQLAEHMAVSIPDAGGSDFEKDFADWTAAQRKKPAAPAEKPKEPAKDDKKKPAVQAAAAPVKAAEAPKEKPKPAQDKFKDKKGHKRR